LEAREFGIDHLAQPTIQGHPGAVVVSGRGTPGDAAEHGSQDPVGGVLDDKAGAPYDLADVAVEQLLQRLEHVVEREVAVHPALRPVAAPADAPVGEYRILPAHGRA
jgi:hypothetical protein